MDGSPLAFVAGPTDAPDIEIRVNFGVFAARDATNAEIEELARDLLAVLARASIVSLRRHELDREHEATIHQVKVEAAATDALGGGDDLEALRTRVLEIVDAWARRTIEFRHAEVAEVDSLPEPVE